MHYPYANDPPLPLNKLYHGEFKRLVHEYRRLYYINCLTEPNVGWDSTRNKPHRDIWSFKRDVSVQDCLDYITGRNLAPSLILWRDYIRKSAKYTKLIQSTVNDIIVARKEHLKEKSDEMQNVIRLLVDELASRNPPKKPRDLATFIGRINRGRERAGVYKDIKGLPSIKDAYEPFAQETIIGTRTIKEWYNHYCERFEDARLSIQQENDKTYKPLKPKPKTPKGKKDERPVHDKDTLAYPFKSKLKQYRKTVDADVPYVEPPEQPRVRDELLHRPYFSHEPGCWEIDHAFNVLEEGDKWMFCINVNTRYLVVYPIPERAYDVMQSLKDLTESFDVKSIRGDGSTKYCPLEYQNRVMTPDMLRHEFESGKFRNDNDQDRLMRWYMNNNITIYFNSSPFTLHNKIVDVVIKTIRNAIGYRRLKPKHMEQLVDYYNNTVHKTIGCTPSEMQDNPEIEYQYIRWCERKLSEIIANQKRLGYLDYKPGNILMVHIDKGKTSEKHDKRRRFFDRLGTFVQYDHGNVVVDMIVQDIRVHSTGNKKHRVIVPLYHTKFVAKNIRSLPAEYKDYYIDSMKEFSVDDVYNANTG